jgi:transcriptional regulator with XRE-family HTH domain
MRVVIKHYRIGLNLTISELAIKVKISKAHMSNIENNKEFPSPLVFHKLAKALQVCPYKLLDFCFDCPLVNCCESKFFLSEL